MAKKKTGYKGTSHSRKTSFNSNLYESSRPQDEAAPSVMGGKMAGIIYRICAVIFTAGVVINYSAGNTKQMLGYLFMLCIDVYLIYVNHKKSDKKKPLL